MQPHNMGIMIQILRIKEAPNERKPDYVSSSDGPLPQTIRLSGQM